MSADSQSINEGGQSLTNLIFGCDVDDGGSADFAQKSRSVTSMRCQCQNGLANSKVLVGFRWDLHVAIRGLEKQETIGVGTFLQGLPVGHVRFQDDQIRDVSLRKELAVQVFRARCAKDNLNFVGAEPTHLFQASDRAEHRSWIALDRIDQSGMNEPNGTAYGDGTRRGNLQVPKVLLVITIGNEDTHLGSEQIRVTVEIHPSCGFRGINHAGDAAHAGMLDGAPHAAY